MSGTQTELEEAIANVSRELEPVFEQSVQSRYLDDRGREIPNPTPMQPPVGYRRHKTIAEQIREQVAAISREAAMRGQETEEEANDFDVGEDFDPTSPYEHDFEIDPIYEHMLARQSAPPKKADAGAPAPSGGTPLPPPPPAAAPADGKQ